MRYPISNFLDFYILQAIKHFVSSDSETEFVRSKSKLLDDVTTELDRLSDDMAQALRDYIFISSFGEARHASRRIEYIIDALPEYIPREDAYEISVNYSPEHNYKILDYLFGTDGWQGPYGGNCWKNIISSLDLVYKNSIPNQAFVDYCADLKHNCGIALDKPIVLLQDYDNDNLLKILDDKRSAGDFCLLAHVSQQEDEYAYKSCFINFRTASLARRYLMLYYNIASEIYGTKDNSKYCPVDFGNEILKLTRNPKVKICNACGKYLLPEDVFTQDGNIFCESCYEDGQEKFAEEILKFIKESVYHKNT